MNASTSKLCETFVRIMTMILLLNWRILLGRTDDDGELTTEYDDYNNGSEDYFNLRYNYSNNSFWSRQFSHGFLGSAFKRSIPDADANSNVKVSLTNGESDNTCASKRLGETCNLTRAKVCNKQNECISACEFHGYYQCQCAQKDEDHCYLCCGRYNRQCRPAHEYGIFKFNGERWERQTCKLCRSELQEGEHCDDKDKARVCLDGMCVRGICQGRPSGSGCSNDGAKVCLNGECEDPCRSFRADLVLCDCPRNSAHQCHLCCYDWRIQKCQSAFYKYGLKNGQLEKPIFRIGHPCGRYDLTCNRYGECSGASFRISAVLFSVCLVISYYCWTYAVNDR